MPQIPGTKPHSTFRVCHTSQQSPCLWCASSPSHKRLSTQRRQTMSTDTEVSDAVLVEVTPHEDNVQMPEEIREEHVIYDYDRDSGSDGDGRMNGEPMFEYPRYPRAYNIRGARSRLSAGRYTLPRTTTLSAESSPRTPTTGQQDDTDSGDEEDTPKEPVVMIDDPDVGNSVSKHRDDGAQGLAQVLDAFVSKMNLEVEPWTNLGQLGNVTYNGPYRDRFGRLKILHARTGMETRMQLTCASPDFHHKGVFFSLRTYPNGRAEDFEVTHPSQLPALFQKIRKAGATEDEVELLYEPLMRFMEKMAKIEKRPFQFCP